MAQYLDKIDMKNIFVSDTPLSSERVSQYQCPLCKHLLDNPVQAECGDRFCSDCFKTTFTDNSHQLNCPQCEEPVATDKVFPDRGCRREIALLKKKCICGVMINISDYKEHVDKLCSAVTVDCPYHCGKKLMKSELNDHMKNCELRLISCEYCEKEIIEITKLEHYEECSKYPNCCPHCEEEFDNFEQKQFHISSDCKKKQYPCYLCGFKGNMEEIVQHNEENHKFYYYRLCHNLSDLALRLENLERDKVTNHRLMQEKIENQEKIIMALQEKLSEVISKNNKEKEFYDSKINKLEQQCEIKKHSYDFDDAEKDGDKPGDQKRLTTLVKSNYKAESLDIEKAIESKVKSIKSEIMNQINSLIKEQQQKILLLEERLDSERTETDKLFKMLQLQESNITKHNSILQDVHLRQELLEVKATNGIFIWKINDLNRRKQDAYEGRTLSLYSPPFFTSFHGYRMCIRCYLNGDGNGKGTHISVFFVVMKSEHDDLLPWPFKQKVTISLLSQHTPANFDANITQSFIPDIRSSSFQKPTKDMNVASGFPKFAPKSVLDEHRYSTNDTIYFKVKVHLSDIPLD